MIEGFKQYTSKGNSDGDWSVYCFMCECLKLYRTEDWFYYSNSQGGLFE